MKGLNYIYDFAKVDWTILPPGIYKICIDLQSEACGNYSGYIDLKTLNEVCLARSPPPGQFLYGDIISGKRLNNRSKFCKTYTFKNPVILWVNSASATVKVIKLFKPNIEISSSNIKEEKQLTQQRKQQLLNKKHITPTHKPNVTLHKPTVTPSKPITHEKPQETQKTETKKEEIETLPLPPLLDLILPLLTVILMFSVFTLLKRLF